MASAALLAQFGATWWTVGFAIVGVGLAVLEMEVRQPRTVLMVVVFNVAVGVLVAPIVVAELSLEQHRGAVMFLALLGGYLGHDLFMAVRDAARARIGKIVGGRK